jgi:hypothetical protein
LGGARARVRNPLLLLAYRGRRLVALRALALLTLALVGFASARAEAWVQTKTPDGTSGFYWKDDCVPVTIYLNNFQKTSGMTVDQIVKSVVAAAHTWSADAVSCKDPTTKALLPPPYLEIVPALAPNSARPPAVTDPSIPDSWDRKNTIVFRTEMWTRNGVPTTNMANMYDFNALAVTTVTASPDGEILDADMEINGVNKSWLNIDPGVLIPGGHVESESYDLQNALTHEFGHFIGLSHTCLTAPVGTGTPRPVDNKNDPVPDCDAAPLDVQLTVMFPRTDPGETSQRSLSPDDIDAVCTIYAASKSSGICPLDSPPVGCAVAPRTSHRNRGLTVGLPAGALALTTLLARHRSRVRSR